MKCPTCHYTEMSILRVAPPSAHLMGGETILWCSHCGTTATTFCTGDDAKLHNLKVPKMLMFKHFGEVKV